MARSKEQLARDARFLAGSPEGERVFGDLFDKNFIFTSTFDPNPNIAAFNEGRRAAMLDVISLIVNEPERFKAESLRRLASQAEGTEL